MNVGLWHCPICNKPEGVLHVSDCTYVNNPVAVPRSMEVAKPAYPTTCAELKAMIDTEWPLVMDSTLLYEEFTAQNCAGIKDGMARSIHRVIRGCGPEIEGTACDNPGMFFTEEQAVRALWWQYNKLSPAQDFNSDRKPLVFYWRCAPEVALTHGIWNGRMRYSGVYVNRFQVLSSMWDGVQL